jgi:Putative Na+/H+ antiporter
LVITSSGCNDDLRPSVASSFFSLKPSKALKYATLGLLLVNISVGGVLTKFASPPVVIVASVWNWDMFYMLHHFGWKAVTRRFFPCSPNHSRRGPAMVDSPCSREFA